ncbi:MAG TPA: efflux RND transporter permease subunit, partial [Spirochaetia bacterium]
TSSPSRTVRELVPPLVASTGTIVIVLMPLLYIGRSVSGLTEVSVALAVMLGIALLVALAFLPAFAAREAPSPAAEGQTRLRARQLARRARRTLDGVVAWTSSHPALVLSGTLVVCAAGVAAVLRMDVVLTPPADSRSVYAHVEFESGTTIDTIDRRTDRLARQVRALPGVVHVQSIARRESSEMTVTITGGEARASAVRRALTEIGSQIPDSFVYIPEGASGTEQAIEVSLVGPDNDVLRATARRAAQALRSEPWAAQVVLNFKDGPPAWILEVNHDVLSEYGLSTSSIAGTLRWGMYGPVALKWFEPDSREIDLRVQSRVDEREDLAAVRRIAVLGSQGRIVSVGQLGSFSLTHPPSRIFRADRQRAVYFTVHSATRNTAVVLRELEKALAAVPVPPGYAFRIDRAVYEGLDQLRTLSLLLIAALFLIFITLATQMESLSTPLLVMSVVPVCLSLPVVTLLIARFPIDVSVIVSLIIMTGIIVNNAILVLDRTLRRCGDLASWSPAEVRRSLRYAVRGRARALFLTSATTILGIVPFLFGSEEGSALFRPLALVVLWGTLVSVAATFLLLPAIAAAAPVFARRFPEVRR